jgi:hypothetical protein
MLFSYGSGEKRIDGNTKCRRIDGYFYCHGNAAVRCGADIPIEHVQGFTRSHWMPPSVECSHRIAPAAAIVNEFVETTQNTNKTQLLASNYSTFRALVISEPKMNPLLSSLMRRGSFKCETTRLELKSSRSFLAIKRCQRTKSKKVITQSQSSSKSWAHICAHSC